MLLGLWIARNVNQVRGVMVAGSSCLLALSIWLTLHFIGERAAGNTEEMILRATTEWFPALHINYEVGVDGISVVMLLLSSIIVFTGTFASWKLKPLTKEFFMWFTLLSTGVYGFFISIDLFTMFMRLAYSRKVKELKRWSDSAASFGREKQKRMLLYFMRMVRENFMYNFHQPDLVYMTT